VSEEAAGPAARGLHDAVLHRVGRDVVEGAVPAGSVHSLERLAERYGVSRTVVREVVKVLEAMHVVDSRRRVGITVLPAARWNVLDPLIVRWRLAGSQRAAQLLALSEVRLAVEPVAAGLAARRATTEQCGALTEAVVGMTTSARVPDLEAYLGHDSDFHRTLLLASGNEAFAAMAEMVQEVLSARTHHHLMPAVPEAEAVRHHWQIAEAVTAGDAETAERVMREVVRESMAAMTAAFPPG